MNKMKTMAALLLTAVMLTGCGANGSPKNPVADTKEAESETEVEEVEVEPGLAKIDMEKWQYHADDDVYWQVGICYCGNPADKTYETMGIFVPGAYFSGEDNGDGTYTCSVNEEAAVGNYTAATAPVIFPVDTPGYSAMNAPADYTDVTAYTNEGFVYMYAGCRGRDVGAPAGVTDLKAAVRYYRYNGDILPGSTERIFSFGMSGGGAQSALMGATGDSGLYTPYLEEIGAVSGVSDAITGSMCWCPITNLDVADAAYEWNLGSARTGLDDDTKALSDGLATAFADYINALQLTDSNNNVLTLDESDEGIYQSGSYYEYIKAVVEQSLNNFLIDTTFPYNADDSSKGGMGGFGNGMRGGRGGIDSDEIPDEIKQYHEKGNDMRGGRGDIDDGNIPEEFKGRFPDDGNKDFTAIDDINRNGASGGIFISGTYETAQDYIDALNAEGQWVTYNESTNKATITSIADFVAALKNPSKDVGAFDALDGSQGENTLFGYGNGAGAHFDAIEAALLEDTGYGDDFAGDLAKTDSCGNTVAYRVNMYNPMYYLCDYYEGAGTANVAKYFRIRTGIEQGDTALCTEINLALALEAYGSEVDFETVWGAGHTQAERTGSSESNFISWVHECLK
ncbi:MAG: tannase [Roseburia sp.]|nr:tannase [Roseburia sp.]MCM1278393.1 tannase [Robinsoniella sp.]